MDTYNIAPSSFIIIQIIPASRKLPELATIALPETIEAIVAQEVQYSYQIDFSPFAFHMVFKFQHSHDTPVQCVTQPQQHQRIMACEMNKWTWRF